MCTGVRRNAWAGVLTVCQACARACDGVRGRVCLLCAKHVRRRGVLAICQACAQSCDLPRAMHLRRRATVCGQAEILACPHKLSKFNPARPKLALSQPKPLPCPRSARQLERPNVNTTMQHAAHAGLLWQMSRNCSTGWPPLSPSPGPSRNNSWLQPRLASYFLNVPLLNSLHFEVSY